MARIQMNSAQASRQRRWVLPPISSPTRPPSPRRCAEPPIFFRKESFARLGVGVSGSRGSRGVRVSCLPAQLCRRLEGGRRALAAMPKRRRNVAVAVTGSLAGAEFEAFPDAGWLAKKPQPAKGFGRRKPGAAICWWIAVCA